MIEILGFSAKHAGKYSRMKTVCLQQSIDGSGCPKDATLTGIRTIAVLSAELPGFASQPSTPHSHRGHRPVI